MNDHTDHPEPAITGPAQPTAPTAPSATGPTVTPETLRALQRQINTLLILLLVISGTFTVYLYQKVRHARRDLVALRPQAQKVIVGYQQQTEPAMQDFLTKLKAFAQENPDIVPYLEKYGLVERPATGAVQPDAAPAGQVPPLVPGE